MPTKIKVKNTLTPTILEEYRTKEFKELFKNNKATKLAKY
jgi:hypothetical protein